MKRNRKGSKRQEKVIRLWTHEQARQAVPYIGSIMRSLRECHLEAKGHDLVGRRLAARTGRLDRDTLIALEEAGTRGRLFREQFDDSLEELHRLDVFCVDPIRGEAVIPFAHDNQLAWFHFDLFAEDPLQTWRYHAEPLDQRRPIDETVNGSAQAPLVV